jgi:hypothetical protein
MQRKDHILDAEIPRQNTRKLRARIPSKDGITPDYRWLVAFLETTFVEEPVEAWPDLVAVWDSYEALRPNLKKHILLKALEACAIQNKPAPEYLLERIRLLFKLGTRERADRGHVLFKRLYNATKLENTAPNPADIQKFKAALYHPATHREKLHKPEAWHAAVRLLADGWPTTTYSHRTLCEAVNRTLPHQNMQIGYRIFEKWFSDSDFWQEVALAIGLHHMQQAHSLLLRYIETFNQAPPYGTLATDALALHTIVPFMEEALQPGGTVITIKQALTMAGSGYQLYTKQQAELIRTFMRQKQKLPPRRKQMQSA